MTTSSRRYVQHIADLSSDYRPQREWGEGRGILMVVGHFLVGIAGGAWVMGALYGSIAAQAVAVGLGVLGAFAHLAFLGKPARAFGMMRRVRTSWIARGFVGLSLFLIGGSAYLASWWLGSDAGALRWLSRIANPIAWVGALTIIGYMGFCYTASKAVPFWHSPLHPAIYIAYAARGGIAALLLVAAVSGAQPEPQLLYLWVGVTAIVVLFFVLEIQGALAGGNVAARWSVRDMLAGRLALIFYVGTLIIGLVVPMLLVGAANRYTPIVLAVIGLASMTGDFFMKLSTVRAGVYLPLVMPARRQRA
jgi:formate-dependent nitrite reductase membrane component NrfD